MSLNLSKRLILGLHSAMQGGSCFHYRPLGPASWICEEKEGLTKDHFQSVARGSQCPLCKALHADPFHIICECPHHTVVTARVDLQRKASTYLPYLTERIFKANHEPSNALSTAYNDSLTLTAPDWSTPSGKALLFRLILVLPWPEACVDDPNASWAKTLGIVLDRTVIRNSDIHPIANSWVPWGGKALLRISKVWSDAVSNL